MAGINPWIGWGISTLLLLFMNRKSRNSGDTTTQQPSKFTESTGNQIGNCIPVVLGRALIKNPLVSYYGDFSWRIYTEEYGMHTQLNVLGLIIPIILNIIGALTVPSSHAVVTNTGGGVAQDINNSVKFMLLSSAIMGVIQAIMMYIFNKHAGRVTIQKGFKYYLGWQGILCWTGDNFGLKRIWMNVYDSEAEASTEQGVWDTESISWKKDNTQGLVARIENEEMFGGVDEGGGFVGSIHFYFGTKEQPYDAWMQEQMYQFAEMDSDMKGLTPKYPMFVTYVVNDTSVYGAQPTPDPPTPPEPEKIYDDPIIVVIGDSISAGYPYIFEKPNESEDLSWTHTYRELSGYKIINMGISGDTSDGMLARFYEDVVDYHPDYVFIETGGNDYTNLGFEHLAQSMVNIDEMIRISKENDIEVRFITPVVRSNMDGGPEVDIPTWRTYLNALKTHISSVGYEPIDYYTPLDVSDNVVNLTYLADGAHPNIEGYELVGKYIYEQLHDLTSKRERTLKVVVIGDSISAGVPYSDNKPSLAEDLYSWTHTYRELSGYEVINSAIGGDTSDGMLARFYEDVVDYHPDYVFIETGGNDYVAHGNDMNYLSQTKKNIDEMIRICEENDIKMRFITPIMRLNMPVPEDIQEHRAYTIAIKDYIESLGFSTTPYYDPLDEIPGILNYDYMSDAVHPNLAGYELVGEFIYEHLGDLPISSDPYEPEPAPAKDYNEVAGGAYIGKQATVPEMWFEVVNYPSYLKDNCQDELKAMFKERVNKLFGVVRAIVDQMVANEEMPSEIEDEYLQLSAQIAIFVPDDLEDVRNAALDLLDVIEDKDSALYKATKKLSDVLEYGVWKLGRIDDDSNPAEVIYEILTNKYWGCDYDITEDTLDIDSLLRLGVTCEEEKLGISCLISNTAQAYEYINKILSHINGVKYDDPTTGKLTFKLIRADYEINKLKEFNTTNCESLDFTRLDWSETSSAISVNFTMATNKYTEAQLVVSDVANQIITKEYDVVNIEGNYFTEPRNARILAQTQLLSAAYPLSAVNIVCNRSAYDLCIGEPIVVSWTPYGIDKQVYRVTDIDYGTLINGRISITAMEDVFGFEYTNFDFASVPVWTEPDDYPQVIDKYMYYELPYEMTRDLSTYVYAYAAQPSYETVKWSIWRLVGSEYGKRNTSTTWSMLGRMVYGYADGYNEVGIDDVGFEFKAIPSNGRNDLSKKISRIDNAPYTYTNRSGLNLMVCEGEIMSYDKIELLPNNNYRVYGIIRGVYDTIPKEHVSRELVFFLDYGLNVNDDRPVIPAGYKSDESLELTTASSTIELEFDINKKEDYSTVRRAESPSIMANLQFNADRGEFTVFRYNNPPPDILCHDILFRFKTRNKFNNLNILTQQEDSVDVELDVKNVVRWEASGNEYEIMFDAYDPSLGTVEEMTLKWATFCKRMGLRVQANNNVHLEVQTYSPSRDLYSYDCYKKEIVMVPPILVGIVTNEEEVQAYADSIVVDNTLIEVPETRVSESFSLSYAQAPLIFIGSLSDETYTVTGQDGNEYLLSTKAFRIDGAMADINEPGVYHASIHEITIDDGYIFKSNFTDFYGEPKYYQYWMSNYNVYYIYTPPI